MKTILWVLFSCLKSPRPLVPSNPRGHRPICPAQGHSAAKKGEKNEEGKAENLVNKGFGGGWGCLGPEGEGRKEGARGRGI